MPHKIDLRKMQKLRNAEYAEEAARKRGERETRQRNYDPNRDKSREVRHNLPDEEHYPQVKAEYQKIPQVMKVDQGLLGIVERKSRIGEDAPNKLVAIGYLVSAELEDEVIRAYFSKDWPICLFDVYTGMISKEPHEVVEGIPCIIFGNYPEPIYHKTFTSHDLDHPDRAFEPHVRNLVGGRINKIKGHGSDADIVPYKNASENFLNDVKEIFKKAGQY